MRRITLSCVLALLALGGTAQAQGIGCTSCGLSYTGPGGLTELTSNGTRITSYVPLIAPLGTAAAPGFAFTGATDTGIYALTNALYFSIQGSQRLVLSGTGLTLAPTDTMTFGTASYQTKEIYVGRGFQGGKSKSLTDAAAATPFLTAAVPTNGWQAGELNWAATSLSGSDQLVANGSVRWWGSATSTTPVCGINKIGTDGEGHSGGANTLVCTWTNVVASQTCALSVTCTNDLAGTQAITLYGRPNMPITGTVVFP